MRTVVMTGGTAGFGEVAAKRIFNTPDTKLILGVRDNKKSSIETLPLDLARLSNVRSFVQSLTKRLDGTKIDILIMNAGAQFGTTKHRTGDGFESTFAINHLAHYLLLRLLTPSLAKNATIISPRAMSTIPRWFHSDRKNSIPGPWLIPQIRAASCRESGRTQALSFATSSLRVHSRASSMRRAMACGSSPTIPD